MKLKTLSEIVDGSIPKVPLPKYLKNLLKEDEACVPSKMNILIGFLRLGNFLSATAIIYIIVISIIYVHYKPYLTFSWKT